MRINFRQGIVSHQSGGFLQVNAQNNIDILAVNRPVIISIAHHNTNYTHSEDTNYVNAWIGPFAADTKYWLYWDFNPATFARSFGYTTLEPVAQSVEPGNGDPNIVDVIPGENGNGAIVVDNHYQLQTGRQFAVVNSSELDGNYTVNSINYNPSSGRTTIYVDQTITSTVADGQATLDIDSDGIALKTDGRLWYNTAEHRHYELTNGVWREVLRVFAAMYLNGTFFSQSINGNADWTGTQIGDTTSVRSGRVLFDETGSPIIRDDHTFFTTEDQFFANQSRVDALRLESNVARALSTEPAIASYKVVAWSDQGKIRTAQYDDVGTTVVGILTEDVLYNQIGSVIIQGVVTNPAWNWPTVGAELWVDNGELTPINPHQADNITFPTPRVPIARVLSNDTVIFEQGLGGVGDQGPPGSVENLPVATTTELGAVTLVTPSSDPQRGYVISDTDPRLTDARPPLPHTHQAQDVSYTPTSEVNSNNVQDAITELGTKKLNLTGGTLTGPLTLSGNPSQPLHAATKDYVDGLVSGLVWLDPIDLLNLISDNITTPPSNPQHSDAYIVGPGGGTVGTAWEGIPSGYVMVWDAETSTWINRGAVTDISNEARFGISMTSSTVASGSFAGHDNEIALYDATGNLTGFEIPTANNAVFVKGTSSLHAYERYAFDGTKWVLFGGDQKLQADGSTTVLTGDTISVKQWADGGQVDAAYWQGLNPNDLNTIYAPINHTHDAASVSTAGYTSPVPNMGSLVQSNVQDIIQQLFDTKAKLQPNFNTFGDLPDPTTYQGMVAYVIDEGVHYFAESGTWVQLPSGSTTIATLPHDLKLSADEDHVGNKVLDSIAITRQTTIESGMPGAAAIVDVAPTATTTYSLVVNKQGTRTTIATIEFNTSSTLGTITSSGVIILRSGDVLELISPTSPDPAITRLTITIPSCVSYEQCYIEQLPDWTSVSQFILQASDGAQNDQFGYSVSITANWIAVGAPGPQKAYIFMKSGANWVEHTILSNPTIPDFGYTVSIDGDTLVVGALSDTNDSSVDTGAAYVYFWDGTTWTLQSKLTPSNGASGGQFGRGVAIKGDTIAVSSPYTGTSGEIYVFERTGSTWNEQTILASTDSSYDSMGIEQSLSMNDSYIVAAAYYGSTVHIFENVNGVWSLDDVLTFDPTDIWGIYADISTTNTIVLGAPYSTVSGASSAGKALVFEKDVVSGTWINRATLLPPTPIAYGSFGFDVAADDKTISVLSFDENGASNVYIFTGVGSLWSLSQTESLDQYAVRVDILGDTAIVGHSNYNNYTGAVFGYVRQ